eukprot:scaffold620_cov169-Amphora_coffeaeformis.AAC.23
MSIFEIHIFVGGTIVRRSFHVHRHKVSYYNTARSYVMKEEFPRHKNSRWTRPGKVSLRALLYLNHAPVRAHAYLSAYFPAARLVSIQAGVSTLASPPSV